MLRFGHIFFFYPGVFLGPALPILLAPISHKSERRPAKAMQAPAGLLLMPSETRTLHYLPLDRNLFNPALVTPAFEGGIKKLCQNLIRCFGRNETPRHDQHVGIVVLTCQV